MDAYLIWLIVAIILLLIELSLNSVYLLAVFIGALTAVFVSFMNGSVNTQLTSAGIITIIGVVVAFFLKKRWKNNDSKNDVGNLDKNQIVEIHEIESDGSAKVNYRGTVWKAYAKTGELDKGLYVIERVEGTRLIVEKKS